MNATAMPPTNREEILRWLKILPPRWTVVRGKVALREIDQRSISGDEPLLSLSKEHGIVPRSQYGDSDGRADSLVGYKIVHPGEIVMNKMQAWNGMFGLSNRFGIVSPEYTVLHAMQGFDARFLCYQLRSDFYSGQFRWRSRGMGTAFFRLHPENLLDTPLLSPPEPLQKAIADYLDAETARVEGLIVKKQQMKDLLEERISATIMSLLFSDSHQWVQLRRVVNILPGYAFSSEQFLTEPEGAVRLLRGVNVTPGQLRWDDTVYFAAIDMAKLARFALRPGDLVIGMDRPLVNNGMRVAEISEADLPCLLVQRVARIRVHDGVNPNFIGFVLRSQAFVEYFSPIVTGVSVPHISDEQILSFRLPLPHKTIQDEIAFELLRIEDSISSARRALDKQIDILIEHRRAMITAAVTGAFEIPTVEAVA